jgi:ELWxxDGT repeat protein
LYFSSSDPATGIEIYRTDGSLAGTSMLKDIHPGIASSLGGHFTAVGDALFFSADDGTHGIELWKSDGSNSGTVMVKDVNPGAAHGIGEGVPTSYGNKFYFSGITSAAGAEAWVSDGTDAGTILLKDLTPGMSSAGFIEYTAGHDGSLYFFASPPTQSGSTNVVVDLWKSSGTTASTTKITSLNRCASCDYIGDYRVYNDKLYFFLNEDHGEEVLWVTDGTPQGTAEIFSLPTYGSIPFFQEVNGHLLFFGAYDYNATPFYRTDGTGAGTEIFRSFNASGHESSRDIEKMSITTIGDQIYFADHDGPANDGYPSEGEDYFQLMRSDGF